MTYKEVASMIAETNLPYAYYQFTEATAKAPPFICFYFSGSNDFAADNVNFQRIRTLVIELYTDNKDFSTEETVETVLNSHDLVYARDESYIDTEKMYMVVYTTEIVVTDEIITEENNNG